MDSLFTRYWWTYLIRGIVAVALGLFLILLPIAGFAAMVIYIGAYMLVDGIFSTIVAVRGRKTYSYWGWLLAFGLLGIIAGILVLLNPFAAGTVLIFLIGAWALLIGIAEIVWAIRLRKEMEGEGWYILAGILSIAFSLVVFFYPLAGAVALAVIFGIYALLIGVILIYLSFRLRKRRPRTIPVE